MQIVGLSISAEQDYCLKRVGFVVSRAIPSRGRAYVKTIGGKDHIDIMDANKKTAVFVGASDRDDEFFEKHEEAAENRPDPQGESAQSRDGVSSQTLPTEATPAPSYELQYGLTRRFVTSNFEAFKEDQKALHKQIA